MSSFLSFLLYTSTLAAMKPIFIVNHLGEHYNYDQTEPEKDDGFDFLLVESPLLDEKNALLKP